jgi:hypothetical protein
MIARRPRDPQAAGDSLRGLSPLRVFGVPPLCLLRQQLRGAKLPSNLTVPGWSTTTIDHLSSVGRTQPFEADK